MLAAKLRDVLEEHGYDCDTDETNPPGIATAVMTRAWDLIAYTSPVEEDYGIPMLNATGFLVGINEDEFIEQLMEAVGKLDLSE
jgi:PTS system galactitol-specific IIB component